MYYERQKAESEAQRGKPEGTLEGEIRIAMWVLEQRPKLVRAGRDKSPITHSGKKENLSLFPPWFPRQFPSSSSPIAPWSSSRDFLRQNVVPLRLALPRISSGMTSRGMSPPSLPWKVALLQWLCASVEVSAATDNATGVSKMPRQSWISDSLFASPRSPQALWCGSSTTDPSTISLLTTGPN